MTTTMQEYVVTQVEETLRQYERATGPSWSTEPFNTGRMTSPSFNNGAIISHDVTYEYVVWTKRRPRQLVGRAWVINRVDHSEIKWMPGMDAGASTLTWTVLWIDPAALDRAVGELREAVRRAADEASTATTPA